MAGSKASRILPGLMAILGVLVLAGCSGNGAMPSTPTAISGGPWIPLQGPYGGQVKAFAEDNSGNVYAATQGAGVFLTSDAGNTWRAVTTTGLTDLRIESLVIDSSGNLFAGSDSVNGGVFKLSTGGSGWQAINNGLGVNFQTKAPALGALVFDSSGNLWAETRDGGVYRLPPGGTTWSLMGSFAADENTEALAITPSGAILAGTRGGVFLSTDQGATWSATSLTVGVAALAIDSFGVVYAGLALDQTTSAVSGGVYRSVNGGLSWANLALSGEGVYALGVSGGSVFVGATTPAGQGVVYVSLDHGLSYSQLSNGLANLAKVSSIASTRQGLFLGANGAFRSIDNGNSWQAVNNGLLATRYISGLVVASNGDIYVASRFNGIARSSDGGATWSEVNTGLSEMNISTVTLNASGEVVAGSSVSSPLNVAAAHAYRLPGNGTTWATSNLDACRNVDTFVTNQNGGLFAGCWWAGLFQSADNGNTYSQVVPLPTGGIIFQLTSDATGNLYAGTESSGVLRSSDGGQSWQSLGTAPGGDAFTVGLNNANEVLTGMAKGLFRFTSGSWVPSSTGISNATSGIVYSDIATSKAGQIFLATRSGVYTSADGGNTWQSFNTGLNVLYGTVLRFDKSGFLYLGTGGGGSYRTAQPIP